MTTQEIWTSIDFASLDLRATVARAYGLSIGREFAAVEGAAAGMTGSDKQVAWAGQIRLETAQQLAGTRGKVKPEMVETFDRLAVAILSETSAAAWIDSRGLNVDQRLAKAMGR